MAARKPRVYRVTVVEHGATASRLAWLLSHVVVKEITPGHWKVTRNRTGKTVQLKP